MTKPKVLPKAPAVPASLQEAGDQLQMPTSTNPFPDRSEAIRVARESGMSISSPGGVTNLPVGAAIQIPAPLPGVNAQKVKGGSSTQNITGANIGPSTNRPTDPSRIKRVNKGL
jgi:hypothetical protein